MTIPELQHLSARLCRKPVRLQSSTLRAAGTTIEVTGASLLVEDQESSKIMRRITFRKEHIRLNKSVSNLQLPKLTIQ